MTTTEATQTEFVPVPKDLKGHVIGKRGSVIQDIIQRSGADISSADRGEEGFTVRGDAQQIACAKGIILEKVEEIKTWELVKIPEQFKGLIIGKGGANLREINKQTGAGVTRNHGEVHIISGTKEQREHAKDIIALKVAFTRVRRVENESNKFYYFIDDCNLPKNCRLKLEEVQEQDHHSVLPSSQTQYRMKPTEEFEPQELSISNNDPSYLEQLSRAVLEKLDLLKRERGAEDYLEADMWCHFGTATIRAPDEGEAVEGEWSIDEATGKFQSSVESRYWNFTFNEKVDFSEDIFKENYDEKIPEEYTEYATRYDLTFLSPCSYQIRCKVWVAKEETREKVEDIPIPSSDVRNFLALKMN